MRDTQGLSLFALRIGLGWLFFYTGITKVIDSSWSAAGYLNNASTFSGFYAWLASPGVLPLTNAVNEWGLTLLGALLLAGVFVRPAGYAAAGMMVLYYFPVLSFPAVGEHSFIIDEHLIYAAGFMVLATTGAGRIWGLSPVLSRRFKKLRDWA